ncbi:hypothetical protein HPP92_022860 [Vanilla planifolia]|uniref:Wall-associated receptor kinase galacturonan-binding domain-containing protein n=1 Tax=Vanilla planifolia TaxID=51239 RepID=A0A835UE71_VANPL|nr:hypothetical protein HPP92_023145 [Vanilla planifolia]KAG0459732.1 hypothetical protein HPP92_022860 [Vanilla planifolia]
MKHAEISTSLPHSTPTAMAHFLPLLLLVILSHAPHTSPFPCRTSCGGLPIRYPLAIDDGCGSPFYRRLLSCLEPPTSSPSPSPLLLLRTPSGSYPVLSLSYTDPHLVISDPSMWTCAAHSSSTSSPPFSLDNSKRFSLSSKNSFLFLNCSPDAVLLEPRPAFCDRSPGRCGSSCDSAAYLCHNLPGCPGELAERATTCCASFPTSAESVRMMLRHCEGYAGLHWRRTGAVAPPYDEVAEYGIRVDFEVVLTDRCRACESKGGGTCGFDSATGTFLCLCDRWNSTTNCEHGSWRHKASTGVIVGTASVASLGGFAGVGALIYYIRKMRSNKVVSCGVQTNENRLF